MVSTEERLRDAREQEVQHEFAMREAKEAFKIAMRAHRTAQRVVWDLERQDRYEQLQAADIQEAMKQLKDLVEDTAEELTGDLEL